MPVTTEDAERLLKLLWETKNRSLLKRGEENRDVFQPKEERALSNAISMLQCLVTDVIPSVKSFNNSHEDDLALEVFSGEAEVQHIEFNCATTRDPGLLFESYTINGTSSHIVYISHIEPGTIADKAELFKRGDVILEINKHSLGRVTVDRARWLMKSAARLGKIELSIVTCDGRRLPFHVQKRDIVTSQSLHHQLHNQLSHPIHVDPQVQHVVSRAEGIHRRPSFTPSLGSKHSDHEAFVTTVEMAAHIGKSTFSYSNNRLAGKNRRLVKAVIHKENEGLGLRLTGGRGSKFGDIGIFICSVEEGKPAHREGSLNKGDEVLMVNGRSVVGFKVSEVVKLLKEAGNKITLIVASQPLQQQISTLNEDYLSAALSSVSLESNTEGEVRKLLMDQETLTSPSAQVMEFIDQQQSNIALSSGNKRPVPKSTSNKDLTTRHPEQATRTRRATAEPVTGHQMIELSDIPSRPRSPSLATLSKKPITQWGRLSASNLHSPSKQSAIKTIVFVKSKGKPLGFSLCGGRGSKLGNNAGIFVKAIQETGEAAKDGRLQVGDEIMVINEQPVDGLTHKMAAQKIKGLNGVISLKVRSDPTKSEMIGTILRKHSSVQGTPITVTLNKGDDEDIGLVIAGLTNDNEEYGVFIKHIKPFSPADKVKLLHRADQLISVNDTSLLDVSINVAMKYLSPARLPGNTVVLQVIRPKKVEALIKLLAVEDDDTQGTATYSTGNNWQGSFRMTVKDGPNNDGSAGPSSDVPLTKLDHDILNLFSSSETHLTNSRERETNFIQEENTNDFPMVVEELKQAETNGDNPILASMTPILSRPSLAKQYSNEQIPNTPDMEMATRRQSGLVNNDITAQPSDKETSFNIPSQTTDRGNHLINMRPFTVSTPPTLRTNEEPFTVEQPPSDIPPPKEPPPDVPLPTEPPPDVPPPTEPSPNIPPPTEPPPDVPLPEEPPPDVPQPTEPPPDPPLPDVPLGYESHQLSITKQKGKKGIGIVLSTSGRTPSKYPVIKRLLPNSVGGRQGLVIGDLVVSVNDECNTAGMNATDVMNAITEAPQAFTLTILRDPSFNSELTPSSSMYAQSVTYTESISSLLSDDDSIGSARRPSISSQLPQIQPLIEGSPLLSSSPLDTTRPQQPSTPPPSPPVASPPPPSTPPPSPPVASPPPPSTPPPSPPVGSPQQPSTPPPSPPVASPPPPSTPPPSPPIMSPPPPHTPPPSLLISAPPTTTSSANESGTFSVEVTKSTIFGLGLTAAKNETGLIEVKQISSRSPLAKEGSLKVHDLLLSINGKDVSQLTEKQAEGLIKSLPKGRITITAMHPPKDVTGQGTNTNRTNTEPPVTSPAANTEGDDEGVVRVTLNRPPNTPLGIIVEGGSDTPLQNVYISSLKPGTAAFNCGQFQRGDQVIMCGGECFIGMSSLEAWDILTKAPLTVEFVLTRRKEVNPLLGTPTDGNQSITARPLSLLGHKRRMSYSLHFPSKNTSMEDIRVTDHDNDNDDGDEDDTNGVKQEQIDEPSIVTSEERFTVELTRSDQSQKLGMGIHGGIDNPNVPEIYVKMVEANGLVGINGMIHRGDRLCSVNGESLAGVTRQKALYTLKNAGNNVTLEVARQVTRTGNTQPASRQYSKPDSVEVTPPHTVPSSGSPSPVMRSGNKAIRRATSIIGRIGLGKAQGIKVVELHKGPTGLGILLNGSRSTEEGQGNIPITVKEVLPGGVAYKSNKINIGDELIEVNNISFEGLSYNEAIKIMKELPQGPATLTLLDKYYVIPHNE